MASLCVLLPYYLLYISAGKGMLRVCVALHLLCGMSQGHKDHQDNFVADWMVLISIGSSWSIKCSADLEKQKITGVTEQEK